MRSPVIPRASSEEASASSSSKAFAEAASEEEEFAASSALTTTPFPKTGDPPSLSFATSSLVPPRIDTSTLILSATSSAIPFWSTSSFLTASHGSLSNLSMAEQAALNFAAGTPAAARPPSSKPRWLSLISWLSRPRASRTSFFFFFKERGWGRAVFEERGKRKEKERKERK
jgi:hypothetical protein